ncbi:hypothetical protein QN277_004743 [Acacia crassicarpa]|uniref:Peptidoglycan binding-like domain-containing protein n=1 Tax=Acacia crassicarpa TaxID=499986 RepID=A0AAE1MIP7_9FABA|nr:hypothetical protein QN277_004743 [Acacia crassicarpa]
MSILVVKWQRGLMSILVRLYINLQCANVVREMQEALLKLGFYSGEEDMEYSSFSSGTERAVKTWQAASGVTEDGIMTAELLEKLYMEIRIKDAGGVDEKKNYSTTVLPKVLISQHRMMKAIYGFLNRYFTLVGEVILRFIWMVIYKNSITHYVIFNLPLSKPNIFYLVCSFVFLFFLNFFDIVIWSIQIVVFWAHYCV